MAHDNAPFVNKHNQHQQDQADDDVHYKVIYGTLIHSLNATTHQSLRAALIGIVPGSGLIAFVHPDVAPDQVVPVLQSYGSAWTGAHCQLLWLREDEFVVPGLIDTHTHAAQYGNIGTGLDLQLLKWLEQVTFPTEQKFSNVHYASKIYERVVRSTLRAGTTTCCYYGTLHTDSTLALAEQCRKQGQRAFVGKICMDRHGGEHYVEASAEDSLVETRRFIDAFPASTLVKPILTPRFAICCDEPLLEGLGQLMAQNKDLPCQTHLSENKGEITFTRELFPQAKNYTDVYERAGLLRDNTVLAHCIHLDEHEMDLIRRRNCGISHCPTSNFAIRSGICPVRKLMDAGIKMSLGTDVSGGFQHGVLTAIRDASVASKVLDAPHLSLETLFYLATLGGAEVCCLEDKIGNFLPGKEFDALCVQTGSSSSTGASDVAPPTQLAGFQGQVQSLNPLSQDANPSLFAEESDTVEKRFAKFIFTGDDRNIGAVFVRGRLVSCSTAL